MNTNKLYCIEGQILKQPLLPCLSEQRHMYKTSLFDSSDSFLPAAGTTDHQLGPSLEKIEDAETEKSKAVDALFQHNAEHGRWSAVVDLLCEGVSVDARDSVHIQPDEWHVFTECVSCSLQQLIKTEKKRRIREFALEKAIEGNHIEYVLRTLPEQKLAASMLQQLTRRIARGPTEAAVYLMTNMGHSNFTEHVWAQARRERRWDVLQEHVSHLLATTRCLDKSSLITGVLGKKARPLIHGKLCSAKGPLRAHGYARCLVYEAVIMCYFRDMFNELFSLGTNLKKESTCLKRKFSSLVDNCQNTEFLLDFFSDSLKKAAMHNLKRLYSFLLHTLPRGLVDISKKTSCEVVFKSMRHAAKPWVFTSPAYSWLSALDNDAQSISAEVDIILEKADYGLLLDFVQFLSQMTLRVPEFLWLCHKALLNKQVSVTDFAPVLNEVLKTVPLGMQTSLILSLYTLSGANLSSSSSSSSPPSLESHGIVATNVCLWSEEDKMEVIFSGPQLLQWCMDRHYGNVVFFLTFLIKHAGYDINWRVLATAQEAVSDFLLLEGVNYATLDGDSASAAFMLQRCTWNSRTLKACSVVLYPLLQKSNDTHLNLLIVASKYRGISNWYGFLKYKQLERDQLWEKVSALVSVFRPADPVFFGEVFRAAASQHHLEVFVAVVKKRLTQILTWGRALELTVSAILTDAMRTGSKQGTAAAFELLGLQAIPGIDPEALFADVFRSPFREEIAKVYFSAGAAVALRRMETRRPSGSACPMSLALLTGSLPLVRLVHESGACSNAALFALDTQLVGSGGTIKRVAVSPNCLHYLTSAATGPRSLIFLAGFAVSEAVGMRPGRSHRIKNLFKKAGETCPGKVKVSMCYKSYLFDEDDPTK